MATTPGFLTDWPWKHLGSFKYGILAPWIGQSVYYFVTKEEYERDWTNFLIFPFLLSRMLHNQLWISFSRYRTAKGNNRIVDKGIEFDQVDRESNWDDQIILSGILLYLFNTLTSGASKLPLWRSDGVLMSIILHAGPVEFLYYWLHRALHHHYLYSRYHSHHHSSIVTEPITSVIHPFAEHIAYFMLFAIPTLTAVFTGTASLSSLFGYITYIDLMNNMGHCNFEFIPKWIFSIIPPLKYLMYTPSYHSLHHTQFRTNYSLFMPIYDNIYGTMDKSTDSIYEKSLKRQEDSPDVVHLTHLTTPESIYHLRLGFSSLASMPENHKWYIWFMWPLTLWTMITNCIYGRTFILERNTLEKFNFQSWAIPRYNLQYLLKWQSQAINSFIEDAILQAEEKGSKVLSLGLLNQDEELNRNGEVYIERHPKIKIKVVDGSSLAVAVVLNSIPKGTTQVLFRGNLTKVAFSLASALSQRGIQVATLYKSDYEKLKLATTSSQSNFVLSNTFDQKIWIVGDGLTEEEQMKAGKGTLFVPFSQLPPKKARHDCFYHHPPAMLAPPSLQNLHACENWLPRRAMSAPRVAGIVHALEGWNVHECGDKMIDVDKIWEASIKHGFKTLAFAE
ncbi:very-long-chain aldehyde decarbonylase CER1-like isoform X1 [Solanum dulcamara]|uniref:very-long-chain aldehyde decarbonylase CER1-like isoform X1 n=1 Tax=Solanum dulcamara TaxID=45834 RepID=UPI002485FA57|nr:very-long-chain aldehyde decarbonylase CER1-like isoform X1 [Solanum dulcamara]